MCMPHFICSSVHRHVGCFHYLAIMSNNAMNICVQVLVWTYVLFLLGMYLRIKLLGYMTMLYFVFGGQARPFSIAAVPFYISTNII